MSDTSSTTSPTGAPPITAPPAAADPATPAATAAEIAAELYKLQTAGQTPAAPAPTNPPSPENLFVKGNIVEFAWNDHYDGPSSRMGIVVATLPDEGQGARSIVAWFDAISGPIGDHKLAAV